MGFGTFGSGQGFTNIDEAPQNNQTWGRRNAQWARVVALIGDTMTGPLILSGDPTVPLQAATKAYVDSPADGFSYLRRGDAWVVSPTEAIFAAQFTMTILGTENAGNQKTFTIPTSRLPFPAFDYIVTGDGLGTFFFTNKNGTGNPTGVWEIRILADWGDGGGLAFKSYATTDGLENVFNVPGNIIYRPPVLAAAQRRFVTRAQGTVIGTAVVCVTPPTEAATLIFGMEGVIIGGA